MSPTRSSISSRRSRPRRLSGGLRTAVRAPRFIVRLAHCGRVARIELSGEPERSTGLAAPEPAMDLGDGISLRREDLGLPLELALLDRECVVEAQEPGLAGGARV